MRFACLLVTERAGGGGGGVERGREKGVFGSGAGEGGTMGGIRDWLNQDVISRNREERL